VKRNVSLVAGAAALGLAVYFSSRLWAQGPAPAVQPPAQTRVALVNTVQVIKSYHKYKTFEDEQRRLAKPFEEKNKAYQDNLKEWQKVLENPQATPQQKEEAEKQIKERKRQIEDNAGEFKRILAKKSDEQLVQLYREVEDAVKRYAGSNGFHIVLQFDERTNPAEIYTPMNIQRKIQGSAATGATVPVFIAPGLDITPGVVTLLNGAPAAAQNAPAQGGVVPAGGR
jgi:Skp family chaperone for outer membrane proteins